MAGSPDVRHWLLGISLDYARERPGRTKYYHWKSCRDDMRKTVAARGFVNGRSPRSGRDLVFRCHPTVLCKKKRVTFWGTLFYNVQYIPGTGYIKASPVMASGFAIPMSLRIVGATSASFPSLTLSTPAFITMNCTGLREWAVLGVPSSFTALSAFP